MQDKKFLFPKCIIISMCKFHKHAKGEFYE